MNNDVYRYTTMRAHDPHWCREGWAVENERGSLVDTYWSLHDTGPDAHRLTDEERATAERVANLDDYNPAGAVDLPMVGGFEGFDKADRLVVPSQHGLRLSKFIRKGALPSRDARIAYAERQVHEAFKERDSALRSIERAREDLHYAQTDKWSWEAS